MLRAINLLGVVVFTAWATYLMLAGSYAVGSLAILAALVQIGFVLWNYDSWA